MGKIFLILIVSMLAFELYAAESKKKSCENIKESCKASGFTKNGHKKDMKGIDEDCFRPILLGKIIEGVVVKSEDVTACKKRVEKRKSKRHEVQNEAREKRFESNNSN